MIADEGRGASRVREILPPMQRIGRRIALISPPGDGLTSCAQAHLPVAGGVSPLFSPMVYAVPGELLAARLAEAINEPFFGGFTGVYDRERTGGNNIVTSAVESPGRYGEPNRLACGLIRPPLMRKQYCIMARKATAKTAVAKGRDGIGKLPNGVGKRTSKQGKCEMPVQDIRIPTRERAAVDPEFGQEMLSLAQELEGEGFSEVAHSLRTELVAYSPERAGTAVRAVS